jgi:hypothetical protein
LGDGDRLLIPTRRPADVAAQVFVELLHLAGSLVHNSHTAIPMRDHGIVRIAKATLVGFSDFSSTVAPPSLPMNFNRGRR